MLGRQQAQLSLSFGVNDIDGTIDDSTKIYSMAVKRRANAHHVYRRTDHADTPGQASTR